MTDQTIGAAEAVTELKPYANVNGQWPAPASRLPKLTEEEAVAAVKKLWRFAMKKPLPYPVKIVSGNRHTYVRWSLLQVNPDKGWHSLVHGLSHSCHQRLFPNKKPHDGTGTHAFLEKEMIQYVVSHGWLDGKLRKTATPPEPKPKPAKADLLRTKLDSVVKLMDRWERKERRAKNALVKLARRRRFYERHLHQTA